MNQENNNMTIGATETPQVELTEAQKAWVDAFARSEMKRLQKQSVWYKGKKVSWKEWSELSFEERLAENNIIRK